MNHSGKGVSEDDEIGAGKIGVDNGGSRYRGDLNTPANHRLRGFPGTTHGHGIGIETVLLEELGLFGHVDDDVPHADGGDSDIYLLQRF